MAPLCIYRIYCLLPRIVAPSVVGFLVTINWLHQARLAWHHPIGWKKAAFWPLKASQIDWHIITYVVQDAYDTLLLNNYAWNKVIFRCKLSFSSIIVLKNSKDYMTTVADHIWFELVYSKDLPLFLAEQDSLYVMVARKVLIKFYLGTPLFKCNYGGSRSL